MTASLQCPAADVQTVGPGQTLKASPVDDGSFVKPQRHVASVQCRQVQTDPPTHPFSWSRSRNAPDGKPWASNCTARRQRVARCPPCSSLHTRCAHECSMRLELFRTAPTPSVCHWVSDLPRSHLRLTNTVSHWPLTTTPGLQTIGLRTVEQESRVS